MNERVPAKTIAARAGVSRSTITRWTSMGLLPKPKRVNRGAGVEALYPPEAVQRVDQIAQLRAQGLTLEEIAAQLREGT